MLEEDAKLRGSATTDQVQHALQLSDVPVDERSAGKKASVASGVLNLANTILGAGMLGLPAAFANCGIAMGLLLLLTFAFFSSMGLYLLSAAADLAGRPASLYAVAEKAQPGSGLLIDFAIAIKCFGVATSYLIVVGDSLPKAMPIGVTGALVERRLWTALAAIIVSPLAYLHRVDALRHTSLVALGCILVITLIIVLFVAQPSADFDPCPDTAASACGGQVTAIMDGDAHTTPATLNLARVSFASRPTNPLDIRRIPLNTRRIHSSCAANLRVRIHLPPEHHLHHQRAQQAPLRCA